MLCTKMRTATPVACNNCETFTAICGSMLAELVCVKKVEYRDVLNWRDQIELLQICWLREVDSQKRRMPCSKIMFLCRCQTLLYSWRPDLHISLFISKTLQWCSLHPYSLHIIQMANMIYDLCNGFAGGKPSLRIIPPIVYTYKFC